MKQPEEDAGSILVRDPVERFAFGENWRRFLSLLTPDRIASAEESLRQLLGVDRLDGRRFLDIGSGSGLFSLAARRLGAVVHSFDYDVQSVACTEALRSMYFPDDPEWTIERGSALNESYLQRLPKFDIVYSWGVLHHTGNMWKAIDNAVIPLKPDGVLVLALYNDQGPTSRYWGVVKHLYHRNAFFRRLVVGVHAPYLVGLRGLVRWVGGRSRLERGMSLWYDMHDWLGGVPFEVATPARVVGYLERKGYQPIRMKCVGRRHGCNEFVFGRSAAARRPKIMFLTRELSIGGAERQLIVLARALAEAGWDVVVLTFYDRGAMESGLQGTEVRLRSLRKNGRWDIRAFARNLRNVIREESPDLVHSYLDAPNIVTAMSRVLRASPPVVWGVRASGMEWSGYDRMRRFTFEMTRALSRVPSLIIANSEAGKRFYVSQGYPEARTVVIPNGIDVEVFQPDDEARKRVRAEWGIEPSARLLGMVGRLDPMKGHRVFLEVATRVAAEIPEARFVILGSGDPRYTAELRGYAEELGIQNRVLWVEARRDIPALLNALDAVLMPSQWGEGFPNVLAEAMACGIPVVATDCGDAGLIMGSGSQTVPVSDVSSLAEMCIRALRLNEAERKSAGAAARQSIIDRFSIDRLVTRTMFALAPIIEESRNEAIGNTPIPGLVSSAGSPPLH